MIDPEGLPEYFNGLVDEENKGIYDLAMEYKQNPEKNHDNLLFLVKVIDIAIKNDENVYNFFNKTIIAGCEFCFESGLEAGYEQYLEDVNFNGFANYSGCIRYILSEAEKLIECMTRSGRKVIPFPGGKGKEIPKPPTPQPPRHNPC